MSNIWLDGLMGLIAGDALGVPVQFMLREEIKNRRQGLVTTMEAFGTDNKPAGTWSDDGSMSMATLASIIEKKDIDSEHIMQQFLRWEFEGEYTADGVAFDEGITCTNAMYKYMQNRDINTCGGIDERSNGNGSLMRILPVCLYFVLKDDKPDEKEIIEKIHIVSGLTHNHLRSKLFCGMYYFLVKNVVLAIKSEDKNKSLTEILQLGIDEGLKFYEMDENNLKELENFDRVRNIDEFKILPEDSILSSGYVVDTFEAALWCLLNSGSIEECLLKAVNLGEDTDSVAAVAGGIAGIYYGYSSIPESWLEVIKRREWIEEMCEKAADL